MYHQKIVINTNKVSYAMYYAQNNLIVLILEIIKIKRRDIFIVPTTVLVSGTNKDAVEFLGLKKEKLRIKKEKGRVGRPKMPKATIKQIELALMRGDSYRKIQSFGKVDSNHFFMESTEL